MPYDPGLNATFPALKLLDGRDLDGTTSQEDFILTDYDPTFDDYLISISGIKAAVAAGGVLGIRVSNDGGGTFLAGAADYLWQTIFNIQSVAAYAPQGSGTNAATLIQLSASLNNLANRSSSFEIRCFDLFSTNTRKQFVSTMVEGAAGVEVNSIAQGQVSGTVVANSQAVDAIRIACSHVISQGRIKLYGIT